MHNSDPVVTELMKEAGQRLGLKAHVCGLGARQATLYAPTDIEVCVGHVSTRAVSRFGCRRFLTRFPSHRGRDGRIYVLDTARVFPPEKPFRTTVAILLPAGEAHRTFPMAVVELNLKADRWKSQLGVLLKTDFAALQRGSVPYDIEVFFLDRANSTAPRNHWASILLARSVQWGLWLRRREAHTCLLGLCTAMPSPWARSGMRCALPEGGAVPDASTGKSQRKGAVLSSPARVGQILWSPSQQVRVY